MKGSGRGNQPISGLEDGEPLMRWFAYLEDYLKDQVAIPSSTQSEFRVLGRGAQGPGTAHFGPCVSLGLQKTGHE